MPVSKLFALITRENMSKETPEDDPQQQADEATHEQMDKRWKGNPEKEQRNEAGLDLENWQKTNTHKEGLWLSVNSPR